MFKSAVIGIGGIGKWHAAMQRDTQAMTVSALCDTNPAHQKWAAETFPDARFYASPAEMFAKEQLDLVSIITPHNLHAPLAVEALGKGINVVVEKPMATSYAHACAMVEAARANKRFVSVFHNRRLDPWFLAAKKAIDAGLIGRIIEVNIAVNYGPGPNTWRGFTEPSGGLQFDWGAHLVDYALHFVDSEVRDVAASVWRSPGKPEDQVDDHAVTHIYFKSGVVAHITSRGKAFTEPQRYHIVGDKGTLTDTWVWGDSGAVKVFTRAEGFPAEVSIPYVKAQPQDYYYNNIAAHLADGTPLLVTGESAARVINVLCAATRSAVNGNVPQPLL